MTIPTSTRIGEIQNAHLADGLTVRVGIPTPSGKLAFNAFNEGYATMVSAHSFWNVKTKRFRVPSASDLFETDFALDSAGFTSVHLWRQKGNQQGMAGIYPWSAAAYLELAAQLSPSWYSAPDFCCEPEISSDDLVVDRHIDATATMLELCLRILYEWANDLVSTCSPDVVRMMIKPPVPVIQGYRHDQYARSLDLTMQVWERWRGFVAPPTLLGVGSVCRRNLHHQEHGLYAVLASLEGRIPTGSRLHLFGAKGKVIEALKMMPHVASIDSMAFDAGARRKAFAGNHSNTMEHRKEEMSRWMTAALRRAAPAAGDQFRLF